jgi:RNA-binding protein YlmH
MAEVSLLPDFLLPMTMSGLHSSAERNSLALTIWYNKQLASFKSILLLKNYLQRTQTLQVNKLEIIYKSNKDQAEKLGFV